MFTAEISAIQLTLLLIHLSISISDVLFSRIGSLFSKSWKPELQISPHYFQSHFQYTKAYRQWSSCLYGVQNTKASSQTKQVGTLVENRILLVHDSLDLTQDIRTHIRNISSRLHSSGDGLGVCLASVCPSPPRCYKTYVDYALGEIHMAVEQNRQMIWRILSLRMSEMRSCFVYFFQTSIDRLLESRVIKKLCLLPLIIRIILLQK